MAGSPLVGIRRSFPLAHTLPADGVAVVLAYVWTAGAVESFGASVATGLAAVLTVTTDGTTVAVPTAVSVVAKVSTDGTKVKLALVSVVGPSRHPGAVTVGCTDDVGAVGWCKGADVAT